MTGYVWGQCNERTEVPIRNIKERHTYYGALDLYNKEFLLTPSDKGNGENTVAFIERLQALNPGKKLMIIWDGASYHHCEEVRAYLENVNKGLAEIDWQVRHGSNQGNTFASHAARNALKYNAEYLQEALRTVTLRFGKLNHAASDMSCVCPACSRSKSCRRRLVEGKKLLT